ncbi:MAG: hypothetical protein BGO13_03490 [Burkholderiales bacterium 66-5]|nr:MAG: hypothetical protein BGO13_03490 [Burkholderiales bacterium 66-5]
MTNKAAYDMAAEVMKKVFHTTQIGDMACLNITMPKTRSFCHIDLIHKTADFSPWERDKWTAFLRISNSYNRTRLLRFELGFCRWICLNGIIFGSKSIEFSYAHTRRGMDRVDRFVENIGDIRKLETALTEKLHQLKRYHVPEKEMLGCHGCRQQNSSPPCWTNCARSCDPRISWATSCHARSSSIPASTRPRSPSR